MPVNIVVKRFPLAGRQLLGIINSAFRHVIRQNDRGRDHRPCQRAPTGLINTRDQGKPVGPGTPFEDPQINRHIASVPGVPLIPPAFLQSRRFTLQISQVINFRPADPPMGDQFDPVDGG